MKKQYLFSIAIILIGGIFGNVLRFFEKSPTGTVDFSVIPNNLPGYYGTEQTIADFAYDVLKADETTLRDYVTVDGRRFQLFVAYFGSQKYGSQIHSPKHCLPGGGWRIDQIRPFNLDLPDGSSKAINRLILSVEHYQAVMLYWYETRSGDMRNEYRLKLDLVRNSLMLRPTDAAIIRLIVDATDGDFDRATNEGVAFIRQIYPAIKSSLPF
jgi:EpsI family protein